MAALIPALTLALAAAASTPLGEVGAVQGDARLVAPSGTSDLTVGQPLSAGDQVLTGPDALALLMLTPDTRLHLGPDTAVTLDPALGALGGTLVLSGAIVFDRPEGAPRVPVVIDTAFGEIGVRGTRVFVGPSRGAYAVFVDRGRVTVKGGSSSVDLTAGQGTEIAAGARPTAPEAWGEARIAEAFALVGLAR